MAHDIYLYGQILRSNCFLLKGAYPQEDTYGEIEMQYQVSGGETANAATVLCSLGCSVKMSGPFMGRKTMPFMQEFYAGKACDLSSLDYDETFDGLEDNVIIAQSGRTVLGRFRAFYADPIHRWSVPRREDIAQAKAATIDPYFGEATQKAAEYCHELNVPYVAIDCDYDSDLHRWSAVNVVSNEFYREHYAQEERDEVLRKYMENSEGLTIFTLGAKEIRYGRKGGEIKSFKPYSIKVRSTLGAGDTFKAGCTYAVWAGMSDDELVAFAAACSGVACTRFPLPLNPPTMEDVRALMAQR